LQRCIDVVLAFIYAGIPEKLPKPDKKQRDAQIYELHLQGLLNDELAKRILREMRKILP